MFDTFTEFEDYERAFNTVFVTSATTILSFFVGGLLASAGVFNNPNTWFIILTLIAIPIIVFIASSNTADFHTAYYRTWQDNFMGWKDQRKILHQFTKQYNIKSSNSKPEHIEVDGRWNFHASTHYGQQLAEQRDLLINRLYQEYLTKLTYCQKDIIESKRNITEAEIKLSTAIKFKENAKALLQKAKSSGEVYKQRQNYNDAIQKTKEYENIKNSAIHQLQVIEQDKINLSEQYETVASRIISIYNDRYFKYTKIAMRKINRVNGLKYEIADMPPVNLHSNHRKDS